MCPRPRAENALNDAVLANASFGPCVHVAPHGDLYGEPGRYVRHFTGVNADKERMFRARFQGAAFDALLALPSWNATACRVWRRAVRLRDAHGRDERSASHTIEFVAHCLDARAVPAALQAALAPAYRR